MCGIENSHDLAPGAMDQNVSGWEVNGQGEDYEVVRNWISRLGIEKSDVFVEL